MTKKRKFATALLATALLSHGFTLDRLEEIPPKETEQPAEVLTENENTPAIDPQHLVAKEEILVEVFDEPPMEVEVEVLPRVATETEPLPTLETQQATAPVQIQAVTGELVPTIPQTQQVTALREPTVNIPELDSMNGIDYGTSQNLQPEVDPRPTYTEEHLTDPTQTPDGTPVEVYVPEVTPPTTTTEENSSDLAYVPGFGWVPIPEACEVIFADDMYQNGNKVGSMGGG